MNEKKKLRRLPKRILSFVLTFVMVFAFMPGEAYALGDSDYITIRPNDDRWGTVSETYYDYDSVITVSTDENKLIIENGGGPHTITATPNSGYAFVRWEDASGNEFSGNSFYGESNGNETVITAVFAPAGEEYPIFIYSGESYQQVKESNKDDVLGNGTVSFDPETNTLTLNRAAICTDTENTTDDAIYCNLPAEETLTINLIGSNVIGKAPSAFNIASGISSKEGAKLLLKGGEGSSLTIYAGESGIKGFDISLGEEGKNFEGKLKIYSLKTGIKAGREPAESLLGPEEGEITIYGGDIDIESKENGLFAMDPIKLSDVTLNVTANPDYGIYHAINAKGGLNITGSAFRIVARARLNSSLRHSAIFCPFLTNPEGTKAFGSTQWDAPEESIDREAAFDDLSFKMGDDYAKAVILHICSVEQKLGQAATCTEDGWNDYYQCTDTSCNKIYAYSSATGTSYADLAAWKASPEGKIERGHNWIYTASGAALTATCGRDASHTPTLTLTASDANYSGSETYAASLGDTSAWTDAGLSVPTIKYYKANSAGSTEGTEEVTELTGLAAGNYYAAVTMGTATAKAAFSITPVTPLPTVQEVIGKLDGKWFINDEEDEVLFYQVFENVDRDYFQVLSFDVDRGSSYDVYKPTATITESGIDGYTCRIVSNGNDYYHLLIENGDITKVYIENRNEAFAPATISATNSADMMAYFANKKYACTIDGEECSIVGNSSGTALTVSIGLDISIEQFMEVIELSDGSVVLPVDLTESDLECINVLWPIYENNEVASINFLGSSFSLVLPEHTHHWVYKADGATLKAFCTETEGADGCDYQGSATDLSKAVSLTLSASSANYSGSAVEATMDKAAWEAAGLPTLTIEYEAKTGSTLTDGKAVNAGSYTAKITVAGKTATKDFEITKASQEVPATGVGYTINYTDETITAETDYEVSTSNTSFVAPTDGKVVPGNTYYVRKKGKDNYKPSSWTSITVAARPTAPSGYTAVDPTTVGGANGKITGVTTAMEYSTNNGTSWTAVSGTEITGLSAGKVLLRVKATSSAFASTNVEIALSNKKSDPTPTPTPTPKAFSFKDVAGGKWYYKAVDFVYQNGIMAGKSTDKFDPEADITRQEFVTILYNYTGKPEVSGEFDVFKDITAGKWYSKPVQWAYENKVASGKSADEFGLGNVTRQEAARFMQAYAVAMKYSYDKKGDLNAFTDKDKISGWAKDAVSHAVGYKVMSGKGNGIFDPTANLTRAEAAQIITSFVKAFD